MNSFETGNLIYLVVLLSAVAFWFFAQNRNSLGKTMQHALTWGLLFIGVIAAVGLWEDIRSTVRPTQAVFEDAGRIEIPRSPDSHYYLALDVNGATIHFVVDTGASDMVLTKQDAVRAGLDPSELPFVGRANTANGMVRTAPVILDEVRLGGMIDRRVSASVNEGKMDQSLLGMSYLQRFSQITIAGNKLILVR